MLNVRDCKSNLFNGRYIDGSFQKSIESLKKDEISSNLRKQMTLLNISLYCQECVQVIGFFDRMSIDRMNPEYFSG